MNGGRLRLISAATLVAAITVVAVSASAAGAQPSPTAQSAKKKCRAHKGARAAKKCKRRATTPTLPPATPTTPATPPAYGPTPASLSISPTSKDYGVILGDSGDETFTVTNSGGSPSGTLATSMGGTDPSHFVISTDNCNGTTLGGGSSCTVLVHCSNPDANNVVRTATMTVTGVYGGSPSASLTCTETT